MYYCDLDVAKFVFGGSGGSDSLAIFPNIDVEMLADTATDLIEQYLGIDLQSIFESMTIDAFFTLLGVDASVMHHQKILSSR